MKLEIEASSIQELAVALNSILNKLLIEDDYLLRKKEMEMEEGGLVPYEANIGAAYCSLQLTEGEYDAMGTQRETIHKDLSRIYLQLYGRDISDEERKVFRIRELKSSFNLLPEEKRTPHYALIDNLSLNW